MNARIVALLLWLLPLPALAQGFAGLGQSVEGFALPDPSYALRFPDDHGAHPAFRIEWWYVTATLTGEDGQDYGAQWTLFRSALSPETAEGWASTQSWMAHAAVTSATAHHAAERLGRGGIGQADVTTRPFSAWLDDWRMDSLTPATNDPLSDLRLTARGTDFAYDLRLAADRPLVLHGDDGYSRKAESGEASYYYSQPFYRVTGTLDLPEGPMAVTGEAWLDREWSSQPLTGDLKGWDWFALVFEDGARLMAAGTRNGEGDHFTAATWIDGNGATTVYGNGALRLTPLATAQVAGRDVPVRWRVELPERGLDITTRALNDQSWMGLTTPYWEGPIRFEGTHKGRGYLEMTGYD